MNGSAMKRNVNIDGNGEEEEDEQRYENDRTFMSSIYDNTKAFWSIKEISLFDMISASFSFPP
jgi:hypothetical protein